MSYEFKVLSSVHSNNEDAMNIVGAIEITQNSKLKTQNFILIAR